MNVSDIKQILAENGLTPNRALGQNFLCDEAAANAIADSLPEGAPVLEIGPGLGSLTEALLGAGHDVAAVEIDGDMIAALKRRFARDVRLTLIHGDFLKTDVSALFNGGFCVAANLPYYATTPICMRLLCAGLDIPAMTLMLQQEAAQRFFAAPGERVYGPLSVMAGWLYSAERLLALTPASYYPQPDVDSAVVHLIRRDTPFEPRMPVLVRAAFAMRRKTLKNNLKPLGITADMIAQAGIDPRIRAEALAPKDFFALCGVLPEQGERFPRAPSIGVEAGSLTRRG